MYSLLVAEGRSVLISILNFKDVTLARTEGDSYVVDYDGRQEQLKIPVGNVVTFSEFNGECFTMERRHGSYFIVDSTQNVRMRLIPKTKKENPNGNRKD